MPTRVDQVSGKAIVHRIDEGMDRQEVALTTYQMRNFYRQLGDGFFTHLDVFNDIQHHQIARKWCKRGTHILDVCCGRGLMLPLLRYLAKDIGSYTGVDIAIENATYLEKRVTDGKPLASLKEYYPFPVSFICSNVAVMAEYLTRLYDVIIYTSALEHMHPEMGQASLHQCAKVAKPGALVTDRCR